ncbi:hypothetical protein HKD37_07G019244 [Glycine soja]
MVHRNPEEGHDRLFNVYFSENHVYTGIQFRRRFHMQRHLFLRIVDALKNHDEYFQMRVDALRRKGLSPLQKCTTASILTYGSPELVKQLQWNAWSDLYQASAPYLGMNT